MRDRAINAVSDRRQRRRLYAGLALLLAILTIFPQSYVSRARVVPQDLSSLGLGGLTGSSQFQGFAALLGGARQSVDMSLAIARSAEVTDAVIDKLALAGPEGDYGSKRDARKALEKTVDIHSLTGGIIEIETRGYDPDAAQQLTQAYTGAISDRIVFLGRDRTERRRGIVQQRLEEAADRLTKAEAALDSFRRENGLAAPEAQLGTEISLRAGLQAQLQARTVELRTLSNFLGPENPRLRAVQSEIASLRSQIARASTPDRNSAGPNVAGLSEISSEYYDLYRNYRFAQALYEVYAKTNEEIAVETLAGETATDVQVIEAARLDADRKFNIPAVAALAFLLLLASFTEIYAPATGIRLPWHSRSEPAE